MRLSTTVRRSDFTSFFDSLNDDKLSSYQIASYNADYIVLAAKSARAPRRSAPARRARRGGVEHLARDPFWTSRRPSTSKGRWDRATGECRRHSVDDRKPVASAVRERTARKGLALADQPALERQRGTAAGPSCMRATDCSKKIRWFGSPTSHHGLHRASIHSPRSDNLPALSTD